MRCTDTLGLRVTPTLLSLLLAACGTPFSTPQAPRPPAAPAAPVTPSAPTAPTAPTAPVSPPTTPTPAAGPPGPSAAVPPARTAPSTPTQAAPPAAAAAAPARRHVPLGPPSAARNWDEFKLQAARRLVQSNPDGSYTGPAPDPLLAIPVLEVELNADGSVRRVHVLRQPSQARDTTQVAIDAVHRAAPYGAMSRLPLPWKWVEVFLFDDQRRFKPRELDK